MTVDTEGYGARPGQSDIERLLEDCRTLGESSIERIAAAGRPGAWAEAEQAALHLLEQRNRIREWDELRNRILDMTERHDALVAWRDEHGEVGHRAEDALLGAALALSARPELDSRHERILIGPMSAALPWLLGAQVE
ncbi:MAG TPA: hypothetical protein VH498_08375 [Candidatus Dormibacteraeota bacterium]|jgi:hypothetical protein|nr:hypothetical protein [Candidatus Dormibacteraeota bacterium]